MGGEATAAGDAPTTLTRAASSCMIGSCSTRPMGLAAMEAEAKTSAGLLAAATAEWPTEVPICLTTIVDVGGIGAATGSITGAVMLNMGATAAADVGEIDCVGPVTMTALAKGFSAMLVTVMLVGGRVFVNGPLAPPATKVCMGQALGGATGVAAAATIVCGAAAIVTTPEAGGVGTGMRTLSGRSLCGGACASTSRTYSLACSLKPCTVALIQVPILWL
mmetsp:Transcript_79072/g.209969  ORF Transcript_79072/g.209969 Transcript_79072/m.209969 type:complete len:220 (-) Transcript_79072:507-1166(-)